MYFVEAPFGQVPILTVNGKKINQSLAIHKYLARAFGEYCLMLGAWVWWVLFDIWHVSLVSTHWYSWHVSLVSIHRYIWQVSLVSTHRYIWQVSLVSTDRYWTSHPYYRRKILPRTSNHWTQKIGCYLYRRNYNDL